VGLIAALEVLRRPKPLGSKVYVVVVPQANTKVPRFARDDNAGEIALSEKCDGRFKNHMAEWSKVARRIRVPLGFLFAVLYFWLARPSWQSLALGAIGVMAGLLVRALASGHVRKNEALATSGPYAYTRNPLYLGSLLMGIGFCVAARSWWVGVALVVMFFAIYLPVIRDEEAFLRRTFPEFEEYARRVPRMVPRITSGSEREKEGPAGFSLELYLKHREYNALIGAMAMVGALIARMELLRP
jgi:protein-S-isoprenylcysteine O-methyltransferase Ste14